MIQTTSQLNTRGKDATRKISKDIEDNIMKELIIGKKLIADPQSSSKII